MRGRIRDRYVGMWRRGYSFRFRSVTSVRRRRSDGGSVTKVEIALERERCRRSAHWFIFDSGYLRTKDEHDGDEPVKAFPAHPYLRVILDCLLVSGRYIEPYRADYALGAGFEVAWLERIADMGMLPVEKSRQVMATWIVCAYLLWRAKFNPYQLILVQSKREDDAANLVFAKDADVGRISFMETHLPKWLRSVEFPRGATYGHLHFPHGSHIWGIPEGGDIIRSNTASAILMDESAFMADFEASYTAARPAIDGGGQLIMLSSAHPGAFCTLVEGDREAA